MLEAKQLHGAGSSEYQLARQRFQDNAKVVAVCQQAYRDACSIQQDRADGQAEAVAATMEVCVLLNEVQ